eukprot:2202658-Ditylum_brightwellii.AAC.1
MFQQLLHLFASQFGGQFSERIIEQSLQEEEKKEEDGMDMEVEGEKEKGEVVQRPRYVMVGAEGGVLVRSEGEGGGGRWSWHGGCGGHGWRGGHGGCGKGRGGGQGHRRGGGQKCRTGGEAAPVISVDAVETAEDADCHLFDCPPSFDESDDKTDDRGRSKQSEVQEAIYFPPTSTNNDCSMLREEVAAIMANSDEEALNMENAIGIGIQVV